MQKVSKQSLAMLALSILLAISIALTFTFAALSGSKKATGTITFSGGFSITTTGFTNNESDESRSFTVTPSIDALGNVTYAIDNGNSGAKWTITNEDTASINLGVTITLADGTNADKNSTKIITTNGITSGIQYGVTLGDGESATITLANIITLATGHKADTVVGGTIDYTITVDVVVVTEAITGSTTDKIVVA